MPDRIRLNNMQFHGYHGVGDAEREVGGRFAVDVEMTLDLRPAGASDDLAKTVNYAAVYDLVGKVQSDRKYHLIEALAERIAAGILTNFPVDEVTVRVRKNSVPIGGILDCAEVEITREATPEPLEES